MSRHIYAEKKREHHSTLSFEPDIRFDLSAKVLYVSEQPVPLPKASIQSVNTLRKTGDRFLQKNKSMKPFSGLME